jgi:hypothetical protein
MLEHRSLIEAGADSTKASDVIELHTIHAPEASVAHLCQATDINIYIYTPYRKYAELQIFHKVGYSQRKCNFKLTRVCNFTWLSYLES